MVFVIHSLSVGAVVFCLFMLVRIAWVGRLSMIWINLVHERHTELIDAGVYVWVGVVDYDDLPTLTAALWQVAQWTPRGILGDELYRALYTPMAAKS